MRENLTLICTECKEENYINTRNKKKHPNVCKSINIALVAISKPFTGRRNKKAVEAFLLA